MTFKQCNENNFGFILNVFPVASSLLLYTILHYTILNSYQ